MADRPAGAPPDPGPARAAAHLADRWPDIPRVAVVLGSGLGAFADRMAGIVAVDYAEIPGFPRTTVSGHKGRLVYGRVAGHPVAAMQGRLHLYEGIGSDEVTYGVRTLAAAGLRTLILTTASGGINRHYAPGDIMLIEDQVNYQFRQPPRSIMATAAAGAGPHWRGSGAVYSPRLLARAHQVARDIGEHHIHRGVFAGMLGPTYETPAEVRMSGRFGADAVSMSTVLEATTAHQLGLEVLGISAIVNPAAGLSDGPLNHEEVLEGARAMEGRLLAFLEALIPVLDDEAR